MPGQSVRVILGKTRSARAYTAAADARVRISASIETRCAARPPLHRRCAVYCRVPERELDSPVLEMMMVHAGAGAGAGAG